MAKFIVFTTFSSQELRVQHRPEHRVHLRKLVDEGVMTLAGAFEDEASGGIMVFDAESAEAVRAYVDADPFTIEGVFATIEIRPFMQVVP